eukprot:CAMPEP_0182895442 /NCGR_PEP_ID=MMETSP0034_2-20130328/25685_1 /TAXON_ID=156128 /ORGANISM="Nephroselmis pyriformis, Strain CCMP717" /LENGTH=59 /DNA_ID=CAMNT_0025029273 /DNA_START=230 /DNA_END=409 /DNA_ORIENTATION=+
MSPLRAATVQARAPPQLAPPARAALAMSSRPAAAARTTTSMSQGAPDARAHARPSMLPS